MKYAYLQDFLLTPSTNCPTRFGIFSGKIWKTATSGSFLSFSFPLPICRWSSSGSSSSTITFWMVRSLILCKLILNLCKSIETMGINFITMAHEKVSIADENSWNNILTQCVTHQFFSQFSAGLPILESHSVQYPQQFWVAALWRNTQSDTNEVPYHQTWETVNRKSSKTK